MDVPKKNPCVHPKNTTLPALPYLNARSTHQMQTLVTCTKVIIPEGLKVPTAADNTIETSSNERRDKQDKQNKRRPTSMMQHGADSHPSL